jgi:hypothetical protein
MDVPVLKTIPMPDLAQVSPRELDAALKARLEGLTYAQIAARQVYPHPSWAEQFVRLALDLPPDVDERDVARALHIRRLEGDLSALDDRARSGDGQAIHARLALLKEIARLQSIEPVAPKGEGDDRVTTIQINFSRPGAGSVTVEG